MTSDKMMKCEVADLILALAPSSASVALTRIMNVPVAVDSEMSS